MRTLLRVARVFLDQLLDRARDGGGEENRLPLLGRGLENQFDVVAETHVEHDVHLVEDDHLDGVEPERAAAHVVHDAARRADDDVRALAQPEELAVVGLAAVDRQRVEAAFEERQLVDFLGNLHGQLARRAKDQHLRGRARSTSTFSMAGAAKAAVLPEPVCDWPTTSLPGSSTGMAAAWMGAACSKPSLSMAFSSSRGKAQFGE